MDDIYAPAREVTRNFRYATEITDLVTAEGILIALECPATARTVRKVIGKLEALSLDHIALTQHWGIDKESYEKYPRRMVTPTPRHG